MAGEVFVIGYGSSIRNDDQIGVRVVRFVGEYLKQREDPRLSDNRVILACAPQLDIGYVERIADSSCTIFVDAEESDHDDPVRVIRLDPSSPAERLSPHLSSPATLASLAQALYNRQPTFYLVAVKGFDFGMGDKISPKALDAARIAARVVIDLIDEALPT
ncbi:MAG: hydrogenase maturation protease [Chloroflexi bacterium]|nr:hydrogenase maturation protease [Chloroflexota bacterium]